MFSFKLLFFHIKTDSIPSNTSSTIKRLLSSSNNNSSENQINTQHHQQQIKAQHLLHAISQFQQPATDLEKNGQKPQQQQLHQPTNELNIINGSSNMFQLSYLNLLNQQIPILLDPTAFLLSNITAKSDNSINVQPATNVNSMKLRVLLSTDNGSHSNRADQDGSNQNTSKRNSSQVLIDTQNVVETDVKRLKNSN